ncbi:hypothetical protein Rctr197k_224 [Virus Rctr197k]|nr:hypothetical protein Rctr197k_224 [Virus Rctr197k]
MVENENNQIAQRQYAMAEVRPLIGAHEARVNITWAGRNADLPDPVAYDSTDGDIKGWVTEAVRAGIPGIQADPHANFGDFVVDRFPADDTTPYNRLMVRPKTPFGMVRVWGGTERPEVQALVGELRRAGYTVEELASGSDRTFVQTPAGEWLSSYSEIQDRLIIKV